jgi:iron complex transport system substrate-binding protein
LENYFMKKINLWLILTLALALVLSACSPKTATPATLTFTDGLGRTVTLASPAQKIVSLAPSATEMLYAVGAGSQMIGRDSFSNYPAEAATLTDIGGSNGNYSYESIAALKPVLVVAAEINTADQVKALTDLGLTVYYISNPKSIDDLFTTLVTVGQLTGHEAEAKTLSESLAARVQAVKEAVSKAATTPWSSMNWTAAIHPNPGRAALALTWTNSSPWLAARTLAQV